MALRQVVLVLALVLATATPISARTPSNDAAAFKMLHLYLDRTSSTNTIDHLNFTGYPTSLASPPPLMVMRPTPGSADTMALFNSFARDDGTGSRGSIYFEVNGSNPQSYSTYAVSPPQYATSLGSLLMGVNIYHGFDTFNDFGKQLATATVTYVDGDTSVVRFQAGWRVRDYWDSGPLNCGGLQYLMNDRPTDALTAYIYENSGYYFDAQESLLPKVKRSKRVSGVSLEGTYLPHSCGVFAGSRLSGFSIWPNFRLTTVSGTDSVVRQSQFTNVDHGGYMFGGIAVGTRRLMNQTACQVASQAMAYTYAGFNCTPTALNAYLRQNKGYEPDQVAIVTFVTPGGGSIRYTATGKSKLNVGDRFLVEHGTYTDPLGTYQVTVSGRLGQATRVATHSATVPSVGDPGRVYWKMKPRVADGFTSSPQLRSIDLYDSPQLAAQVESLLVRDIAVELNVPDHFVVAHGWTSSFRPDGSARGTYFIRDPFDDRNYTKLIEGKYRNSFTMARYVIPTGALVAGDIAAGTDPPGIGILASGARRVEIIDPLGRHMMRDASTGEGVYEIPDAAIEDVSSEHDNGGDVDDPLTGYDIEIPTTVDGHYTITVYSDDGLAMSVNGYTSAGIFASDDAVDTTAVPVGNVYDVLFSGSGQTVSVTLTGTLGVNESPSPVPSRLRVRRNPTTGPVAFILSEVSTATDDIDVFDITGRRVDSVPVAPGAGTRAAMWDWRSTGIRPGVYLARLRSRPAETIRFVVLD